MTRLRPVLFGVLAILTVGAATAAATPRVVPGWPVPAPAGTLLPAAVAGGGPVLTATTSFGTDFLPGEVTASFTAAGRISWQAGRPFGCGNCDGGGLPARLWPNGVYASLGVRGDDWWGVDRSGHIVRGCRGAFVGTDCVDSEYDSAVARTTPDGAPLWRLPLAGLDLTDRDRPASIVADGELAFVGVSRGPAIVAIDLATGTERWRFAAPGAAATEVKTELPGGGVLADTAGETVAVDRAGHELWRLPGGTANTVTRDGAGMLIGLTRFADPRGAYGADRYRTAQIVDARTGRSVWSRAASTVLAGGSRGLWYVRSGRLLRAIDARGRTRWSYPTTMAIFSARELANGRVALSEGAEFADTGILTVIDPSRAAGLPTRPAIALSRSFIRPLLGACRETEPCSLDPSRATILGVSLPRAGMVSVIAKNLPGTPDFAVRGSTPLKVAAPRGTSYLRLFPYGAAAGRYRVKVRIRQGNRVVVLTTTVRFR